MIFTQDQIWELLRIVDFQYSVYIGKHVGTDILTHDDLKILRDYGFDVKTIKSVPTVEQAFQFGRLSKALGNSRTKSITNYNDFKKFLAAGGFADLNRYEQTVLNTIKSQSYGAIKSIGESVKLDIRTAISNENIARRSNYEDIIRSAAKKTVADRTSLKNMMLEIGNRTQDWNTKLGRIVETEMHNAFEEGRATMIQQDEGSDALVYKDVYPGACRHCIRLFLTGGLGSEPRVFKLSELRANGTNVGRKAAEYLPVIGAVHPYCRCTLNIVPFGYKWDKEKRAFTEPDKEFKRQSYAHIKAPLKVTIGDKEYVV